MNAILLTSSLESVADVSRLAGSGASTSPTHFVSLSTRPTAVPSATQLAIWLKASRSWTSDGFSFWAGVMDAEEMLISQF